MEYLYSPLYKESHIISLEKKIDSEMIQWLENNTKFDYKRYRKRILFISKEDAMTFKLVWS